ncbi:uncharacterized protein CELE_R05H11.2 [Caenorhabditis elegans]|uniref:Uncharacterized protein n=1 Tax=Caenorhabditis elegans TaxID=6239 RepID=Q8IFZ7_CAEEL|nr:Uncharacterized protein CELE_R05H11.2 [Caenorhabditis elegans]CCD70185.2 Uncharacterized protein CELE_R05H11.2 [Caenorhabditis elegans]|eukprot:NP_871708.3 Uncharacterized protein CELE_R05H11.2 [Caenorhabditis elegans]
MKYTCEAMRRMSQSQSSDTYFYHPYRQRKNSTTSTYSDCSSVSGSPSSSTMTSSPPPQNFFNIYDRLKEYISEVPKDPVVCQILLDSLAQIIELERQLADLEQKTEDLKMRQSNTPTTSAKWYHEKVPEDLINVDVTEFKHLVHSAPLVYDTISY